MSKNAYKGTKPALKNSVAKKKKKSGRGGARPGAGRKPKPGDFQQISIDTPLMLIVAMEEVGIKNKTAFINYLIAAELKNSFNPGKKRTAIEVLEESLKKTFREE